MPEHRGKTFSPADHWVTGGTPFAFKKLEAVEAYLTSLAAEELERDDGRHWWQHRRVHWQRVYDLQDGATTISDAIHYIDPDGELRGKTQGQAQTDRVRALRS